VIARGLFAGLLAALVTLAASCVLEACTTHILADADRAKLENAVALEGQMYKDLVPEAGVPTLVLQGEAAGLYCSDESVLEGSGKVRPDAGLVCPKLR
jgi:hypothetical protein